MPGAAEMIRFAIAGLGSAGIALIGPVMRNPVFRLAAVADSSPEVCARFSADFPETMVFSSVDALVDNDAADVVFIATPTHLHTDHVAAVIRGGKHVISEKPIATNLDDAHSMIEAAEKAGVIFMVGHSFGYETPIREIRRIVRSGVLGDLRMLHNWYYTDWIYRPRVREELDTVLGGGVTFRQGSHQVDIIRMIGGGRVRSVRAMTGDWDPARPAIGAHTIFLDFEEGVAATAVYSGYDRFRSAELGFAISEGGLPITLADYAASRRDLARAKGNEPSLKQGRRYGGENNRLARQSSPPHQPFYGLTLVSCERGDIRQSPNGLLIYAEEEKRELVLPRGNNGRDRILVEFQEALATGRPPLHCGRWGLANLEVCLAAIRSAAERREIPLSHQKAVED